MSSAQTASERYGINSSNVIDNICALLYEFYILFEHEYFVNNDALANNNCYLIIFICLQTTACFQITNNNSLQ